MKIQLLLGSLFILLFWPISSSWACHNTFINDVNVSGTAPNLTYTIDYCVSLEDGFDATTTFDISFVGASGCSSPNVSLITTSFNYSYNILTNPFPAPCTTPLVTTAISGTATCSLSGGIITCVDDGVNPIGPNPLDVACCSGTAGQCGGGNPPISYPDINSGNLSFCFSVVFTSDCPLDELTVSGSENGNCSQMFTFPLPVTLSSFEANKYNEYNILNWETQSEINNSHFAVERSVNGYDFQALGSVEGAGNSVATQYYEFSDRSPFPLAYYRLAQFDWDGKKEYSPVISVERRALNSSIGELHPNPVQNTIYFYFSSKEEVVPYRIVNSLGQVFHESAWKIEGDSKNTSIEVSDLPDGVYFLIIKTDNTTLSKRFVKI